MRRRQYVIRFPLAITYLDLLPDVHPQVAAAHGVPLMAAGFADVVRAKGRLAHHLADRLNLPEAGNGQPVTLRVTEIPGGYRWRRCFGDSILETTQVLEPGRMIERHRHSELIFRVRTEDGEAIYESVCARWRGILIPRALSPRAEGRVTPHEHGWIAQVEFRVPVFGLICSYTATLRLT